MSQLFMHMPYGKGEGTATQWSNMVYTDPGFEILASYFLPAHSLSLASTSLPHDAQFFDFIVLPLLITSFAAALPAVEPLLAQV